VPFYPSHCHITGIDLSAPMLREAEKKRAAGYPLHDLDLIQMDAGDLEFADGAFDRVLASYVLSTVPDAGRVLDEIVRVCRPGGRVVVVNHFRSAFPPVALGERLLRPLTWVLGFRLDLPLSAVTRHPGLVTHRIARANFLGLWKLLIAERRPA
jgi:phosphatidylethanolamine/phosphatidyl-N-methylethanolamine N-methyltransferase